MKKRKLIERRRALKEAYYNELRKQGVIDTPKEETKQEPVKKVVKAPVKKTVKKEGADNGK